MSDESSLPFFTLTANPYTIPDDLARELAAIVIEWGGLENAITADLESMRMWPVVRALTDSDALPGTFGGRLKLWRRSIAALYPSIKSYNDIAEEIATKARAVGIHRHRIIHGYWQPDEADPKSFNVLTALDRLRKDPDYFRADVEYLAALHADIKNVSAHIWGFLVSRQLHVSGGLLRLQHAPSDEPPVLPAPRAPEKP
jgi:hypothetical protein